MQVFTVGNSNDPEACAILWDNSLSLNCMPKSGVWLIVPSLGITRREGVSPSRFLTLICKDEEAWIGDCCQSLVVIDGLLARFKENSLQKSDWRRLASARYVCGLS